MNIAGQPVHRWLALLGLLLAGAGVVLAAFSLAGHDSLLRITPVFVVAGLVCVLLAQAVAKRG